MAGSSNRPADRAASATIRFFAFPRWARLSRNCPAKKRIASAIAVKRTDDCRTFCRRCYSCLHAPHPEKTAGKEKDQAESVGQSRPGEARQTFGRERGSHQ